METALVSLVCIAVLIVGMVTVTFNAFQAATTVSDSLREMEQQAGEIRRTEITLLPPTGKYGGGNMELRVRNDGQINLAQFSRWDVIAQYPVSGGAEYLDYLEYTEANPPGSNQWTVEGIYIITSSDPEVYDPNVLNPGEMMQIILNLDPGMDAKGLVARVTVSTPNGVTSQCLVERE